MADVTEPLTDAAKCASFSELWGECKWPSQPTNSMNPAPSMAFGFMDKCRSRTRKTGGCCSICRLDVFQPFVKLKVPRSTQKAHTEQLSLVKQMVDAQFHTRTIHIMLLLPRKQRGLLQVMAWQLLPGDSHRFRGNQHQGPQAHKPHKWSHAKASTILNRTSYQSRVRTMATVSYWPVGLNESHAGLLGCQNHKAQWSESHKRSASVL